MVIQILRVVLILLWIPSQYLGVLLGALGGLGWQMGEGSTVLIGGIALIAPAVLTIGGLYLSFRRPELGAKVLVIPIAIIALELAVVLLFALGAQRR